MQRRGGVIVRSERASERSIRDSLRPLARDAAGTAAILVDEFWVPPTGERADLVSISSQLCAYEIKSTRDTLRRLPRQIGAFSRLFDRCTAVLATKHVAAGEAMIPHWWGVIEAADHGDHPLEWRRRPLANPAVDVELLVRLLWRDEALAALTDLGVSAHNRLDRQALWRLLIREAGPSQLQAKVCHALLHRTPDAARIPTRRFTEARAAAR